MYEAFEVDYYGRSHNVGESENPIEAKKRWQIQHTKIATVNIWFLFLMAKRLSITSNKIILGDRRGIKDGTEKNRFRSN